MSVDVLSVAWIILGVSQLRLGWISGPTAVDKEGAGSAKGAAEGGGMSFIEHRVH